MRTATKALTGAIAGLALVGGGVADGAQPLRITHAPSVSGKPQVGTRLQAVGATWTGPADTQVAWHWLRCAQRRCRLVDGALSSSYTPTGADVGSQLVAWLTITAGRERADSLSTP